MVQDVVGYGGVQGDVEQTERQVPCGVLILQAQSVGEPEGGVGDRLCPRVGSKLSLFRPSGRKS